ncbi:hypothetical protein GBA52_020487 [Prunus armeniaca]|nr:hypothetical protein GBA52_020487 [Prunus armeniaca]
MDGSIIGRCRFGCKTLSILICKDTKHSDICSQICSRFKELQVDEIELTYAVEEHSSCLLETDMDVRVLHLSFCNENINAVDINVIRGGGKVFGNGEQDKMDSSDSEGNTSTDENEYLGKYAAKEECDANSSRFERLFISYHASIEGFKFCRPFLCLDGTFVKNKYKGHMLAATRKNGNQGRYPASLGKRYRDRIVWCFTRCAYAPTKEAFNHHMKKLQKDGDYYRNCYDIPIVPVPDVEKESPEGLEDFIVKPPLTKKPPGRPRTKRIKSSVDDRRANKCSQCGHASQHNRKTCNHQI